MQAPTSGVKEKLRRLSLHGPSCALSGGFVGSGVGRAAQKTALRALRRHSRASRKPPAVEQAILGRRRR